jgi:hypothetical protein
MIAKRYALIALVATGVAWSASSAVAARPATVAYIDSDALINARPLSVIGLDGSSRSLVVSKAGFHPAVSPDGRSVAFLDLAASKLMLATLGGDAKVRIRTFAKDADRARPVFSPDGRWIAYEGAAGAHRLALIVRPASGGSARVIDDGQALGFDFSPDSSRLVYVIDDEDRPGGPFGNHEDSEGDLMVADAQTGRRVAQLTHDSRNRDPRWGAHGIAYSRIRERVVGDPRTELRLVQSDGTGVRVLLRDRAGADNPDGYVPVGWSRDGRHLIVNHQTFDRWESEGWTLDLDGRARDLTGRRDGVTALDISADGRWVLASRGQEMTMRPGAGTLLAVPFGGGPARTLVKGPTDGSWSDR